MKDRHHYQRQNAALDPETDYEQMYRNLSFYDFPWDINQALNFALFRTYAVPSIGNLLFQTAQLTEHAQKRYDDTVILLEIPARDGYDSATARSALRRINQMHALYDIPNEDMLYVLSTFVVVPVRWIGDFGWRPLLPTEQRAVVNYYRRLGQMMGLRDIPETYGAFARLMDSHEAAHFAFDVGGRKVADSTMKLLQSFYPAQAGGAVNVFSRALMNGPLLEAFRYDDPGPLARRLSRGALKLRARVVALLPPKPRPTLIAEGPTVRSYPQGYRTEELGTFKRAAVPAPQGAAGPNLGAGCPFPHAGAAASSAGTFSSPAPASGEARDSQNASPGTPETRA